MRRQVYFENWQEQLEATIEDVAKLAAGISWPECDALRVELDRLNELLRQVRDVTPPDREAVRYAVLPWTVNEPLELPEDIVMRLSEIFEIYRRFRTRLSWHN
jgi:hypothetical protein